MDDSVHSPKASAADESRAPSLVLLPDPESRSDVGTPLLGRPVAQRLIDGALALGFESACIVPGAAMQYTSCAELPVADPVGRAALVVFEGTYIHPNLLRLMVEHPLDPDEQFSLYDGIGRPAACFIGRLSAVPEIMPVAEEIAWPEGLGPEHIARVVYEEDRVRAELLILSQVSRSEDSRGSIWAREINLRTLRFLAATRASVAQLELVALLVVLVAGPLALIEHGVTLFLGALCLLGGVHVAGLLSVLRRLKEVPELGEVPGGASVAANAHEVQVRVDFPGAWTPGETIAAVIRPLSHAGFTAILTYTLVAERERSSVAGLVLLMAGGAAAVLLLAHTRSLLRGTDRGALALPDGRRLLHRLGVELPSVVRGAPLLELAICVGALSGVPEAPWTVLVAAAASRLWRWFTAPVAPDPPRVTR